MRRTLPPSKTAQQTYFYIYIIENNLEVVELKISCVQMFVSLGPVARSLASFPHLEQQQQQEHTRSEPVSSGAWRRCNADQRVTLPRGASTARFYWSEETPDCHVTDS